MVPTTRAVPDEHSPSKAQQIARAASDFERQLTGQGPRSFSVAMSHETLVITLYDVMSPAERNLAQGREGAAQVQQLHREIFLSSCGPLREAIARITGVAVREATAEVEPSTGTVVRAFSSDTEVWVFLLAGHVEADAWGGSGEVARQSPRRSGHVGPDEESA